ncbi:MAG TPA: ROK family protein [Gammaproteobacteria bacterium]|nr:ROK family protein [Gammaproteobacteria bacterium]
MKQYIGIDLGGTKIAGVVMDQAHALLHEERVPTPRGYEAILAAVADMVRRLWRHAPGAPVGIGAPGSSDREGLVYNSNTVCFNGRPLRADLEARLGVPLRLANDANCLALSEAVDGAARGAGVVFGVILGTGVGGGVVVNSSLLTGPHGIAGEWGHNVLEPGGPPCYCGKRGCVETLLSGPGMRADHVRSGGEALDPPAIVAAAQAGDALAEACLDRYLDRFARALSVVINILDPDCIVLGGGLSNMTALYDEGAARVRRHVFHPDWRGRIVKSRWGDASGVRGAAWLWK